jgi:hypothetical protein
MERRYNDSRSAKRGNKINCMTIRTILVDDEKLAIQGLQLRLQKFPDVEMIDTCANGREAIRKIKTESPTWCFSTSRCPASTASPWSRA